MTPRLAPLFALLLLFGCTGGSTATLDASAALLTAEEVREGCVASTLDVMGDVVDRIAPAAGVADLTDLIGLAAESGCNLVPGELEHLLACPDLTVRGETVALTARLTYTANGIAVADLAEADGLEVEVDARGVTFETTGFLTLRRDGALRIEGELVTTTLDGCEVAGTLDRVTALTLADAPGAAFRALFTSGNVDLGVTIPGGQTVTGTAALIGRNAIVALEVSGVFSQAEITLR